jgi:hypothetical protein
MFTDEYLIPGFYLVKQNQRILLHTLIFLIVAGILSLVGNLIGLLPVVASFTLSGLPVSDLSANQAMNILSSDVSIIAGASVSFIILFLNMFIWLSFYIGGVVQEIIEPKNELKQALRSAFGSIRLTLRPLIFIVIVSSLLAFVGLGLGWGIWLLSQIWVIGSLFIFLGVTASVMFLFLSSLTVLISNMERIGVMDSVRKSMEVVKKGSVDYFLMFFVLILVNTLVLLIPIFGIFISLITLPISIAALAGYYHTNKHHPIQSSTKPTTAQIPPVSPPGTELKEPRVKPVEKPVITPKIQPPLTSQEKKAAETESDEKTKKMLDKILKDI